MSPRFKLAFGIVCLLLGWGYIYRPHVITRVSVFLRDWLLNDAHIALERRKWGVFFLLIGFLFIYMGLTALGRH